MPRHNYVNPPSTDSPSAAADFEELKRDFARRLQAARLEKGWNQAELARAAGKHMHDGVFGRDLIGPWERAVRLPSPVHLSALARALGMMANELLPYEGVPGVDSKRPTPAELRDVGNGQAWIKINKQVPWDVALQVMKLINPEPPKSG